MKQTFAAIIRWRVQLKSLAYSDMHRMASGISGAELPQVPVGKEAAPLERPLQFSLRRRQQLAWQRYICGGSH